MLQGNSYYSISWKEKDSKTSSVFVGNRILAIKLYLAVRKRNKTAELHLYPAQSACIKMFGGKK